MLGVFSWSSHWINMLWLRYGPLLEVYFSVHAGTTPFPVLSTPSCLVKESRPEETCHFVSHLCSWPCGVEWGFWRWDRKCGADSTVPWQGLSSPHNPASVPFPATPPHVARLTQRMPSVNEDFLLFYFLFTKKSRIRVSEWMCLCESPLHLLSWWHWCWYFGQLKKGNGKKNE